MSHTSRIKQLVVSNRCPIKRKPFDSLNPDGLNFLFNFMSENRDLSDQEFKGKAHYLFIDAKDKPKNHIEIIEVLMTICKV